MVDGNRTRTGVTRTLSSSMRKIVPARNTAVVRAIIGKAQANAISVVAKNRTFRPNCGRMMPVILQDLDVQGSWPMGRARFSTELVITELATAKIRMIELGRAGDLR